MTAEHIISMVFAIGMKPHDLHEIVTKGRKLYFVFIVKYFVVFVL